MTQVMWVALLATYFVVQKHADAGWTKPVPVEIQACTGSNNPKGCADAKSIAVVGTASAVSVDAGWIEGQISLQAALTSAGTSDKSASMVWIQSPPTAPAPVANTNFEGITCSNMEATKNAVASYTGWSATTSPAAAVTTGAPTAALMAPVDKLTTLPAATLTKVSILPDPASSPTGKLCVFAFSLANKLAIANYSAVSTLGIAVGKVTTTGTLATGVVGSADNDVIMNAATITPTASSFLSGWTWVYKGGATIEFLGQVFGRTIDQCKDDCVALRLEQITAGISVTVRARLAYAILTDSASVGAAYTVALTNDVTGKSALGFGCNVGAISGADKAAAQMSATPIKFTSAYDQGAIFNPNITTATATLWNQFYGMVECNMVYPVVKGMTDIIDWTAPLYVVYKTVQLNSPIVTTGDKPNVGTVYALNKMADATAQGYHQIVLPFKVTKDDSAGQTTTTPKSNGSVCFAASGIMFVLPLIIAGLNRKSA